MWGRTPASAPRITVHPFAVGAERLREAALDPHLLGLLREGWATSSQGRERLPSHLAAALHVDIAHARRLADALTQAVATPQTPSLWAIPLAAALGPSPPDRPPGGDGQRRVLAAAILDCLASGAQPPWRDQVAHAWADAADRLAALAIPQAVPRAEPSHPPPPGRQP